MWYDSVSVKTAWDQAEIRAFLARFNLEYDAASDVTLTLRRGDRLIATGSLRGRVLQCFAVEPAEQGSGLAGRLIDRLIEVAWEQGHTQLFVFTVPANVRLFGQLGFRMLAETPLAALLETGMPTISDFVETLQGLSGAKTGVRGGLVMNCNPFTLGHQYLVEQAAESCAHVFLQVVEEDLSVFPYDTRRELVVRGVAHLQNVTVLSTGPYAVSLATFPSYFTAEQTAHARAGASIDAEIYGRHIAKALGITRRFVGTEPLSPVTSIYNAVLSEVLAGHGVELIEIPRLSQRGQPISASAVRRILRKGDYLGLSSLVPASTRDFLLSARASGIIERLKHSPGRH